MKCDEKEAARAKPFEPESSNVVVCEGFHDMGLVCALSKHLGITNCDVTYPKKSDGGNGKDAIKTVVELLAGRTPKPSGLLIVTDADADPNRSFEGIKAAFCSPYPAPPRPFVIHKARNHKTGVFLIPGTGKTGALEALLLAAVQKEKPDALKCIEQFEKCTNTTSSWSDNKKDKMRMACYVASHCKNDPCCSLAFMWSEKNLLLNLTNPVFEELGNFLKEFSAEETQAEVPS